MIAYYKQLNIKEKPANEAWEALVGADAAKDVDDVKEVDLLSVPLVSELADDGTGYPHLRHGLPGADLRRAGEGLP